MGTIAIKDLNSGEITYAITSDEYIINKLSADVRAERNRLLSECDWTQAKDIPSYVSDKWVDYRQALRDVTLQNEFPINVIWPVKP